MVEMLPNLTLITPDGVEIVFSMPATGKDGNSELVIPALEKLATGSMVSYQVCLFIPGGEQICGHDTFLIWNTNQ